MQVLFDRIVGDHRFIAVVSERADGDIHPERVRKVDLDARQRAIAATRWVMLDQVHGTHVVDLDTAVGAIGWPLAQTADALITRQLHRRIAVWAGDCAPIALFGADGAVAVVHGGWRGLAGGIVDTSVDALGTSVVAAVLGPVIHPCCYEFGSHDLEAVASGVHADVKDIAGATVHDGCALDVPAAVEAGLANSGFALDVVGPCTGCDDRWFSHRVRADSGRHAIVAWSEPADMAS